jgi:hypothetical protein
MQDEEKLKHGLDFLLHQTLEGQELFHVYETPKIGVCFFFPNIIKCFPIRKKQFLKN